MSTTSHPDIPLWIQNRIVGFFNWARNVEMILDGTIKDDPSDSPGRTVGRALTARILREGSKLPDGRFADFEQIGNIQDQPGDHRARHLSGRTACDGKLGRAGDYVLDQRAMRLAFGC